MLAVKNVTNKEEIISMWLTLFENINLLFKNKVIYDFSQEALSVLVKEPRSRERVITRLFIRKNGIGNANWRKKLFC